MIRDWSTPPIWSALGWTMLHFLWVGGVLSALASAGRGLLRRAHPDVRYGYALASLIVLAVTPAVIAAMCFRGSPAIDPTSPEPRSAVAEPGLPQRIVPVDGGSRTSGAIQASAGVAPVPRSMPLWRWLDAMAAALPGVWLVGAPLTFVGLAMGLAGAERLRRRSDSVADLAVLCARLAKTLGVVRNVTVAVCERISSPILLGVVRPIILLPTAALTGWSPEQVEMALLHELAHVRRWDNVVNLAQRLIESALFFHPGVWVISGWVRREREHCCDRIVVDHTGRALDYAEVLFKLTEINRVAAPLGVSMAESHLAARICRILSPEERSMKLSRTAVALAGVLLTLPIVVVSTYAQKVERSAPGAAAKAATPTSTNRQLRNSGPSVARRRLRDPNAPPWQPIVPPTITIQVAGVARDEAGRAIAGATITLYSLTDKGSKPAGTATTNAEGRYIIRDGKLAVSTSFGGPKFPDEITPYALFILSGMAPGLGISWSPQQSMYALEPPHPDDIQDRLPLADHCAIDLTFPKVAVLKGKVVDEDGQPVKGAKLQVLDSDLLDGDGRETNNRQGYDWKALPSTVGRAVTARDGSFRIEGLADRACFWIWVNRPETDNTTIGFYAATIDGPDTTHEQLPANAFNGRGRHEVKTNPITIVFPKIRPIAVTVVGDDNGKPIEGARVMTLNNSPATGITSYGTTDAMGKVLLGLPPGQYQGIEAECPIETRYIRTHQRPLAVERGEGAQPYEIRQKAGVELILEAVRTGTNKPVADVFFWKASEENPEEAQHTSLFGSFWTDAKGEMRVVLPPEPGKRYRFRFAGIHEPNDPPGINPLSANKQGFEAFPSQSAPVELVAGKTIRLRFILRKEEPAADKKAQ